MYYTGYPELPGQTENKGLIFMTSDATDIFDDDSFYTLVPEQGLCLVGDDIVNLRKVSLIRKLEGKTLVYCPGMKEPVILPLTAFDRIRDAVFAAEDLDDDEFDDEDE